MKALRTSLYTPQAATLKGAPTTVVLRECDLREDIDVIDAAATFPAEPSEGMFILSDIFDVDDNATIQEATVEGMERMRERRVREADMAIHYYWNAMMLQKVNEEGVLRNPAPAPLSATEIRVSMRRLAKHPNYQRQTVVSISEDEEIVTLADGKVSE